MERAGYPSGQQAVMGRRDTIAPAVQHSRNAILPRSTGVLQILAMQYMKRPLRVSGRFSIGHEHSQIWTQRTSLHGQRWLSKQIEQSKVWSKLQVKSPGRRKARSERRPARPNLCIGTSPRQVGCEGWHGAGQGKGGECSQK